MSFVWKRHSFCFEQLHLKHKMNLIVLHEICMKMSEQKQSVSLSICAGYLNSEVSLEM